MANQMLIKKNVPQKLIDEIVGVMRERSVDGWNNPDKRRAVLVDNLMIRFYLDDPMNKYAECRKAVQESCPEYHLDDQYIRVRAENMGMSKNVVRSDLCEWAYGIVSLIYDGMAGDKKAIAQARNLIEKPYKPGLKKSPAVQDQLVLFAMFEYIPELRKTDIYKGMLFIARKFMRVLLNKVLAVISFEVDSDDAQQLKGSVEELRREVYLARNELAEYKAMVEAADAEYDDKIAELTQQELSSFFSSLNNEKYGFIIDTAYLLNRACADLKKNRIELPYSVQGIPALLDRLLKFFKDVGISPASRFAPHSEQHLTLAQMEGCRFEPLPERKKAIGENEIIDVKVLSSGWRYGDAIISYPVLHEKSKNE